MAAVGEQQESLLLRELETDITVSRCMQILSFLEQNIDLVRLFIAFSRLSRDSTLPRNVPMKPGKPGKPRNRRMWVLRRRIAGKMRNRLTESQLQTLKSNYLKARDQFYQVGFHVSPI